MQVQFLLHYQPQVDIQTNEVTGFEALVRWNHPERGEVSPGVFVPIAEESGLILQIGEWVMRTACAEAARWKVPLGIAVNVSAVQIHSPAFSQTLLEVLLQTGLKAERLEIEITETALVRDITRAVATLRQVRGLGVHIAMDDFGTGYSSLANLRAFPFSQGGPELHPLGRQQRAVGGHRAGGARAGQRPQCAGDRRGRRTARGAGVPQG